MPVPVAIRRQQSAERLYSSYQSNFSKRTVESSRLLPLGRPPQRSLSARPSLTSLSSSAPNPKRSQLPSLEDRTITQEAIDSGRKCTLAPISPYKSVTFQWMKGSLIGEGNQGKVYMALNVTTGELMAVKQVERPQSSSDRMNGNLNNIADALRAEQETLSHLSHPNIVQYLGFEENEETLNIFLEYVSGGTIASCIETHGRFREDVTKHFTYQILQGLSYLHSRGILHRDMKAANILVTESGTCKISDFGVSKRLDDSSRAFSFTGTSFWMAPETLRIADGYDSKIDIWSVGCVLHEMWSASRPWCQENFISALLKLTHNELPPLPDDVSLSALALHFRKECFQVKPQERPTAAVLLLHPYLLLPPSWEFPGMQAMGSVPVAHASPTIDEREISLVGSLEFADCVSPYLCVNGAYPSSEALSLAAEGLSRSSSVRPLPSTPSTPPPVPPKSPRHLPSPSGPRHRSASVRSVRSLAIEKASSLVCEPSTSALPSATLPKTLVLNKVKSSNARQSRSEPYQYNPPHLPSISQSSYSTHLLPPSKYLDATSKYPQHLLRRSDSTPALSRQPHPPSQDLPQRSNSTGVLETHQSLTWTRSTGDSTSPRLPARQYNLLPITNTKRVRVLSSVPESESPISDSGTTTQDGGSVRQKPPTRQPVVMGASTRVQAAAQKTTGANRSASSLASTSRTNVLGDQISPSKVNTNGNVSSNYRGGPTRPNCRSPVAVPSAGPLRPLPLPEGTTHGQKHRRTPSSTRPGIKEVIQKLDDYFPEHNLDFPLIVENPNSIGSGVVLGADIALDNDHWLGVSLSKSVKSDAEAFLELLETEGRNEEAKRVTMRSIKSIVEEHIHDIDQLAGKDVQRSTRLWGSRVEEIRLPR